MMSSILWVSRPPPPCSLPSCHLLATPLPCTCKWWYELFCDKTFAYDLSFQFRCPFYVSVWYDLLNVSKIGGLPKLSVHSCNWRIFQILPVLCGIAATAEVSHRCQRLQARYCFPLAHSVTWVGLTFTYCLTEAPQYQAVLDIVQKAVDPLPPLFWTFGSKYFDGPCKSA